MEQATAAQRSGSAAHSHHRSIVHQLIAGSSRGPGLRVAWLTAPTVQRAVLHPTSPHRIPSAMVAGAVHALRSAGHTGPITTPALTPDEAHGFRQAGFTDVANLLLFRLELSAALVRHSAVSGAPQGRLRFASLPRRAKHQTQWLQAALAVDQAAFPPGEGFDELSLDEALRATPRRVVRFALPEHGRPNPEAVIGYAITGRAGRRSYLQRLAVHPASSGAGVGGALCADSIRWARGGRASVLAVNTRVDNVRAASLYTRLGFVPVAGGLVVLGTQADALVRDHTQ